MSNEQIVRYKSILDYSPPFKSIVRSLGPEIEFSLTSLLNNPTIKTYFNMLSIEYYNFEYNQLISIYDLVLKDEQTGMLNLTILELVYNIVYQIVLRRWKYSTYISYDVYALPIRIEKYCRALNYELKRYKLKPEKDVFRLCASPSKHLSVIINKYNYSDGISIAFENYRASINDYDNKILFYKEIINFADYTWPLIISTLGINYAQKIKNEIEWINETIKNNKKISDKEKQHIMKLTDRIVDVSMFIFILMIEKIETDEWDEIVKDQQIVQKQMEANELIENVNNEIKNFKKQTQVKSDLNIDKKNKNNQHVLNEDTL